MAVAVAAAVAAGRYLVDRRVDAELRPLDHGEDDGLLLTDQALANLRARRVYSGGGGGGRWWWWWMWASALRGDGGGDPPTTPTTPTKPTKPLTESKLKSCIAGLRADGVLAVAVHGRGVG